MKMSQTKAVEEINIHLFVFSYFFRKSRRLWDNVEIVYYSGAGHKWQYGACALHAG